MRVICDPRTRYMLHAIKDNRKWKKMIFADLRVQCKKAKVNDAGEKVIKSRYMLSEERYTGYRSLYDLDRLGVSR